MCAPLKSRDSINLGDKTTQGKKNRPTTIFSFAKLKRSAFSCLLVAHSSKLRSLEIIRYCLENLLDLEVKFKKCEASVPYPPVSSIATTLCLS